MVPPTGSYARPGQLSPAHTNPLGRTAVRTEPRGSVTLRTVLRAALALLRATVEHSGSARPSIRSDDPTAASLPAVRDSPARARDSPARARSLFAVLIASLRPWMISAGQRRGLSKTEASRIPQPIVASRL
jgi:hypothetical protein